jgi:Rrf2 family protein
VRVASIAEAQGIPSHFLVQILLQLKSAGLVSSTRGASGGYQLVRNPAEVSLADVLQVMEGGSTEVRRNCGQETNQARALVGFWNELSRVQQRLLAETTIQDLLERATTESDHMYYI